MDGLTSGRIKDVYVIRDSEKPGVKAFWMRIGRAFVNHDGSLNVYLDAMPTNGKIHIRDPKPRSAGAQGTLPESPLLASDSLVGSQPAEATPF